MFILVNAKNASKHINMNKITHKELFKMKDISILYFTLAMVASLILAWCAMSVSASSIDTCIESTGWSAERCATELTR
jgi:hypothetical protein